MKCQGLRDLWPEMDSFGLRINVPRARMRILAYVAMIAGAAGALAQPQPASLANRLKSAADDTMANVTGFLGEVGLGPAAQDVLNRSLSPADAKLDRNVPLGLFDAWKAAFVNDPQLRAARAALASGRERVPQAKSQLMPSVQYSAGRFKNESERNSVSFLGTPQTTTERYFSQNETLALRQPLFRQVQKYQVRQASFVVGEAEAGLARETQNLGVRLGSAYFEALLALDHLRLVDAQRLFLTTQLDAVQKGLRAGLGTRTDVDEVQARLDLLIAQSLEANQQVDLTQRQLQSIVGSPFSGLAQLDPQRFELLSPLPGTVDEWISLALESSPEIRALSAQQGAAREEIAKSRAGHLPTLDAIVQVQRSRSENANLPQSGYVNTSIGFQFNLPLYQGGYVSSVSRQAQADFERISELLEATRRELGIRVHKEYRGVTEGLARVKALEVAVRSADVALDSARKSLAAGVRTTVDVLNAQQQRVQVSRDLSQARYMTLLAKIRLEALAGRIDDGLMERLGRSVSR